MITDLDVPVVSRDGTTLRVNCYCPISDETVAYGYVLIGSALVFARVYDAGAPPLQSSRNDCGCRSRDELGRCGWSRYRRGQLEVIRKR